MRWTAGRVAAMVGVVTGGAAVAALAQERPVLRYVPARGPVIEIVDPLYTVLVKIPKARLPK